MKRKVNLAQLLAQADSARQRGAWEDAGRLYALGAMALPNHAGIRHNQALCALALNRNPDAVQLADAALALNPELWQSELVRAKAFVALGEKERALGDLQSLHRRRPENADVRQELASLLLHELGDARAAREMVAPLLKEAASRRDALLTSLVSRLYDREIEDDPPQALNDDFRKFASQYLDDGERVAAAADQQGSGRRIPRVGLLSPQFCASPVFYLTYGALRELANSVHLIFVHRGVRTDWATEKLKAIGAEWVEAASSTPEQLRATLQRLDLDVLFDLGGWMDCAGLQAISAKPVRRQYKWVGGQSVSTGLKCFDGWLSDRYQTPPSFQKFYTEPLVLLDGGYVTYTPPPYFPEAAVAGGTSLGVIANPAKVSRPFLADVARLSTNWSEAAGKELDICFIDRRYRHEPLRQRILGALCQSTERGMLVRFVAPASHQEYLNTVGQLHAVLDTYPYTGGLTTLEALFMGVPCRTTAVGTLFSERHTYAHCKYAGMTLAEMDASAFVHDHGQDAARRRGALLRRMGRRTDHAHLAEQLLSLIAKPRWPAS